MTTLYKRANGPQQRMLRMISGAVLNTAHAHPGQLPDERFARGVSKRAVGTISAEWAELLAENGESWQPSSERRNMYAIRRGRCNLDNDGEGVAGETDTFTKQCRRLGKALSTSRAAGDLQAVECLLAALVALAPLARRERGKPPL